MADVKKHDEMLVRSLMIHTGYRRTQIERALASIDTDENAGTAPATSPDEVKTKALDALSRVGPDGLPFADKAAFFAFLLELGDCLKMAGSAESIERKDGYMHAAFDVLDRMRVFLDERQAEWDRKLSEHTKALLLDPNADPDELETEAEHILFDAVSHRRDGHITDAAALEEEAAPLLLKAKLINLSEALDAAEAKGV